MAALTDQLVRRLYVDRQFSAGEIAERTGVTMWQVYAALRRFEIPRRLPSESNTIRFERQSLSFQLKQGLSVGEEQLKIAALMLYWGEGAKSFRPRHAVVDIANSDPAVLQIFLRYLREIVRVDESRLHAKLYCFANQDVQELTRFWSRALRIPTARFSKPFVRRDYNLKHQPMRYGLAHAVYADKKLLRYFLGEIDRYRSCWADT